MKTYTITEIARITGGEIVAGNLPAEFTIEQLVTDSRTLLQGEKSLFFALTGPRNNGHLYISELIRKKVPVFVVSQRNPEWEQTPGTTFIFVSDTLEALQKLAGFHRSRFLFPVIGITGSNGKTVIKEWLHDLLSDTFSIVRSPKSYNSQVGVPLSVWHIEAGHNLAIFEAGISQPGEMANLEKIIRPAIGIFTNIGDAHQENFSSFNEKAAEKLLLFSRAEQLVFCADQPQVAPLAYQFCQEKGISPVDWSLQDKKVMIRFTVKAENGNTRLEANWNGQTVTFSIPFADSSSVENACHCFAALVALNAPVRVLLSRFSTLEPLAMRLELKRGVNNCLLLNDYYNSDINSLDIALSVLARQAEKNHLKKIVILSDIRQSGFSRGELYRQVNKLLVDSDVELLIGIGPEIEKAAPLFSLKTEFYNDTRAFITRFKAARLAEAAILIKGARDFRFEEISSVLQKKSHQTVLEINLNALTDNLNQFRALLKSETKIMVMVKAFSYGSGDVEIAKLLQFQRVDYLAVAVADEGVELRNAGISLPIIVMNPEVHSFQLLIDYHLEPNLYSPELAQDFAAAVEHNALRDFPVHLKIDTGMNRLGFKTSEEIEWVSRLLERNPQLHIQSVFSHLAASDDPAFDDFTREQIATFEKLSSQLLSRMGYPVDRHILNSGGIERFSDSQFEMVRLGIGLYGVSCTGLPLQNISILKSVVSQIKTVSPEETVGYSRAGKVGRKTTIAIVPLGYADGLDRRLGNAHGCAFTGGKRVPIIGNICMDMCMIDVTEVPVKAGDEVEFFGNHIPVTEVAATAGTIPYEILTGISQRVKRIYIQE